MRLDRTVAARKNSDNTDLDFKFTRYIAPIPKLVNKYILIYKTFTNTTTIRLIYAIIIPLLYISRKFI